MDRPRAPRLQDAETRGSPRAPAASWRRRPRRRRLPDARQADPGQGGADGRTGHQRCRMRALHHLRRPADARTRRGSRARHRHLPRPAATEEGADRHRGQQAGSRRRHACRGRRPQRAVSGRPGADALPGRRRQATDPRSDRQGSPGRQALDRPRRPVLQRRHRLYRLARHRPWRAGRLAAGHGHRQRARAAQLRGADRHADGRAAQARPAASRYRRHHHGRPDDGLPRSRHARAGGQGDQLPDRARRPPVPAQGAGNAMHPLRRLRAGLPARTPALRDVLVRAGEEFRQDAGVPHLRLHRVRLLLLRLPVAHPAGPVFPLRQERNLGARAREERRRRRQGALRVQAGARGTRKGGKGREAGQGGSGAGGQESCRSCGCGGSSEQPRQPRPGALANPRRKRHLPRSTPKKRQKWPPSRPRWSAPGRSAKPPSRRTPKP